MRGPDDCEVATVEGSDLGDPQPLASHHDGGIDRPQGQVVVGPHELGDAQPIARLHRLDGECPSREIPQKADFRRSAESRRYEVDDLGDHQMRDDQGPGMGFQQLQAGCVVPIIGVDVGIERAGVN